MRITRILAVTICFVFKAMPCRIACLAVFTSLLVHQDVFAQPVANTASAAKSMTLHVSDNGHFLVDAEQRPVFMLADTGWGMVIRLKREQITQYLERRRSQGFNAIAFVLYAPRNMSISGSRENANAYHDVPFSIIDGRADPTQPLMTKGSDPARDAEYDYWDHLDFTLSEMKRLGLYAIVLPCWGNEIVTKRDLAKARTGPLFNEANARQYGEWLGTRYVDEPHVVWMLGGDVSAVDAKSGGDFRPVFRAMAAGLKSTGNQSLISYHSQKTRPQSSDWFQDDSWLAFNSIQHWPDDQIDAITRDWNAKPTKPTWIFEGRYEGYWRNNYKPSDWGAWQSRQQAWQTVLSGAFGHTYGHERVFGFGADGVDWKSYLDTPGATDMTYLASFMRSFSPAFGLTRTPDQSLIAGDQGTAQRLVSNRITASRTGNGSEAVFYIANGRSFKVRMNRLAQGPMNASWFNPRSGKWRMGKAETAVRTSFVADLASGAGANDYEFDPPGEPGDENDWVLIVTSSSVKPRP